MVHSGQHIYIMSQVLLLLSFNLAIERDAVHEIIQLRVRDHSLSENLKDKTYYYKDDYAERSSMEEIIK